MARRKQHDPEKEYKKLDEWTRNEAAVHAEADARAFPTRGWICQCAACRLVRTALYEGAGNAERP